MRQYFSKQNRALLSELVRTDFKLRYQGSILGYTWSLLRPMMMFGILYVVFVKFLRIGSSIPGYPVYLLLGIVLWTFFGEVTSQGLGSIVGRGDLIRKISIPRWIIVMSSSISGLINLTLNMVVIGIILFFSHIDITSSILLLPLYIIELYVLSVGIALLLATLFVRYRDIVYVWEVFLQGFFYLVPILYPLSIIKNVTYQKILLLNPIAQTIQDARNVAVTQQTITVGKVFEHGPYMYIPFGLVIILCVIGVWLFRRDSKYFAERV